MSPTHLCETGCKLVCCSIVDFTLCMVFAAGSHNKEFTFRHDWNSLISDDETLQMRYYSRKYFPPADDYVSWPCAGFTTVMRLVL